MTSFTFILTCFLSLLAVRLTSGHNIGVHVIGFPEKEENENVKNLMVSYYFFDCFLHVFTSLYTLFFFFFCDIQIQIFNLVCL